MQPTKQTILSLLSQRDYTVAELHRTLNISTQMIHRHLKTLIADGLITKRGTPPLVVYQATTYPTAQPATPTLNDADIFTSTQTKLLDQHFLDIDPAGNRRSGPTAFLTWCAKRGYDPATRINEYVQVVDKYQSTRKHGLLEATDKLLSSFDDQGPERMWYVDVYSYEVFGKTKLGQLVLYAKQSADKALMAEVADMVRQPIAALVKRHRVDAVGYVAPTIRRPLQFMEVMKQQLDLELPEVTISKLRADVVVPQKTLKSKADRQVNARDTFVVRSPQQYQTVLLIDDAVGSGASFYEIGKKLRQQGIAQRVLAVSLVGSANDFPVVNEV